MNLSRSLVTRVEQTSLTALLAVGDVTAIAAFVAAGEVSHGYSLVADAGRVAGTLAPFLIGWTLVAVAGNLYTRGAVADLRSAVVRTLSGWGVAVVIAQLLRSTSVFHGDLAVTFALVSFAVGGALLLAWRGIVAYSV